MLWACFGFVLIIVLGYGLFSWLKPESKYSINNISKHNIVPQTPSIQYGIVHSTLENAYISISFQDRLDMAQANEILKNYASLNDNMTYNVFQDRFCSYSIKPKTSDLQHDISTIEPSLVGPTLLNHSADLLEATRDINGNPIIVGTAHSASCAEIQRTIESFGFTVININQTPVYATVKTDTNKKEALLELLNKDVDSFQNVQFDYPV